MLTTFLLASALPLVSIDADNARLDNRRTFVSKKAELVLAGEAEGDVLCLDRAPGARTKSICLVRGEWSKAVTMANAQPRLRNMYRAYNMSHGNYGGGSKYGLGSSPSTFGSRH